MKDDSAVNKFLVPYYSERVPQPKALSCDQVIKLMRRYQRMDMSLDTDTCHHIRDHLDACFSCYREYVAVCVSVEAEHERRRNMGGGGG